MKLCKHCNSMSHIKMAVNSHLFGTFLFFLVFTIKCFIYGIMLSHLKAFFFYKTIKEKQQILTQFAENKTSSDAYIWADGWSEIESLLY